MRENGSGAVRVLVHVDADAVKAVESGGVKIDQAVRLEDLDDAGWSVGAWARGDDGSAALELTKEFDSTDDVAGIVRELSGKDGPLQGVRAERESGFLATKYAVRGKADLESFTTGVPNDEELLANLTAQGVDPKVIDQQLLEQVKASFTLKVSARLPGQAAKTITAKPGAVTPIDATSSVQKTSRLILLVTAFGLAGFAALLWFHKPGRRPRPAPRKTSGGPSGPRRGPHMPHVPRPHIPHPQVPRPQLPHPHLPHPHLPHIRSRPQGPAPPPRKPKPKDQ